LGGGGKERKKHRVTPKEEVKEKEVSKKKVRGEHRGGASLRGVQRHHRKKRFRKRENLKGEAGDSCESLKGREKVSSGQEI